MSQFQYPGYYSITPATVRYDFARLSWFEIVLFGELTSMSTVYGYAFPSNKYLSELFSVNLSTITRALSNLSKCGHISIVIDHQNGNERRIFIVTPPICKNAYTPIGKNASPKVSKDTSIITSNYNLVNPNLNNLKKTKKGSYKPDIEISWLDDFIKTLK